jgi:hypothetical protein
MDETSTPAVDMTAALVVVRTNADIIARLEWLVRRATANEEEIVALLHELNRRRASLPPSPPT